KKLRQDSSSMSSTTIVNGRVSSKNTVTVTVELQAPSQDGIYPIPPAKLDNVASNDTLIRVKKDNTRIPEMVRDEGLLHPVVRGQAKMERQLRGKVFIRPVVNRSTVYKWEPVEV